MESPADVQGFGETVVGDGFCDDVVRDCCGIGVDKVEDERLGMGISRHLFETPVAFYADFVMIMDCIGVEFKNKVRADRYC